MSKSQNQSHSKRFAITASDRYLEVFNAFVSAGWEPIKLFTVPTSGFLNDNKAVIARAQKLGMEIQMSRLDNASLAGLARIECDLLVVASYDWRIGRWQDYIPRAINFHPSPLPRYRGPYPLVRAILDDQTEWGVTCHKLAAEFDQGDILAQRVFSLTAHECHESLDLKTQMAMSRLALDVALNFEKLWSEATPQGDGSYVGIWTDNERTLDFGQTTSALDRQLRAFGNFQCIAVLHGIQFHIQQAVVWPEKHSLPPGTVVLSSSVRMVVSCLDGFVGITRWSLLPPHLTHVSRSI